MSKKSFVVIGAGQFGTSVARTIASSGAEVMVVDKDENNLENVSEYVTHSICGDATNPELIRQLGIKNYDGAIIGIGRHLEPTVLITIQMKELGIPHIITLAENELEARILRKVGADRVVSPDKEFGIRLGNQILNDNYMDMIELSDKYSITDYNIPAGWIGKTIKELNVRGKYGINIIGVRGRDKININPAPDDILKEDDVLIVLGHNSELKALPH
ncbi:MAG: TrkA family potassium uptake protein [Eubacterium sp.]|nr:TrkA family potassium uptake protein [Eubacterium sp.]